MERLREHFRSLFDFKPKKLLNLKLVALQSWKVHSIFFLSAYSPFVLFLFCTSFNLSFFRFFFFYCSWCGFQKEEEEEKVEPRQLHLIRYNRRAPPTHTHIHYIYIYNNNNNIIRIYLLTSCLKNARVLPRHTQWTSQHSGRRSGSP